MSFKNQSSIRFFHFRQSWPNLLWLKHPRKFMTKIERLEFRFRNKLGIRILKMNSSLVSDWVSLKFCGSKYFNMLKIYCMFKFRAKFSWVLIIVIFVNFHEGGKNIDPFIVLSGNYLSHNRPYFNYFCPYFTLFQFC